MWRNMVSLRNLQDEARSIVLNFLKSVDKVLGTAIVEKHFDAEDSEVWRRFLTCTFERIHSFLHTVKIRKTTAILF